MTPENTPERKKIVILGAGFGGLRAAIVLEKKLARKKLRQKYEVILVDKNDSHTYTPLLYEIATTSEETATALGLHSVASFPIHEIAHDIGVAFIHDKVEKLDLLNGDIHLAGTQIKFDYLVLALGSETNYFGIAGLEKYSFPLKTFENALRIRDQLCALAEKNPSASIVIGGAGSTGIELAGEIKEAFPALNVTIVEAVPTIFPGFHPEVIAKANARLHDLNIATLLGQPIKKVKKNAVMLQNKTEVPFDLLVWAGGVKSSRLITDLPIKREERGRAEVLDEMECLPETPNLKLHGQVYALGDLICFNDPKTNRPVPWVARAAIEQANVIAENIVQAILSKENKITRMALKTYIPKEYPYVIPIGGNFAISKIGNTIISGKPGWILKLLVEINYLLSIMPFRHALRVWIQGIKIFVKNDRLG